MPFPVMIAIAVIAVSMMIWSRLRLRKSLAENKDKSFGVIAQRLWLVVEAGDPTINLLYFQTKTGDYQRQLRASGKPYQHPTFLTIVDGVATSEYVVYRKTTLSFGCYLEMQLDHEIEPFEVVLRAPNQYLVAEQSMANDTALVEVAGDQKFIIRAAGTTTAAALQPALEVLEHQHFVHLAGSHNRIWINFTRMALPSFSFAPEEYLVALETAACGLSGKPLPARVAT
jgi:hypothetical protein